MEMNQCMTCCKQAKFGDEVSRNHRFCSKECQNIHYKTCSLRRTGNTGSKTIVLHGGDSLKEDTELRRSILSYMRKKYPAVEWTTDVNAQGRHIFLVVLSTPRIELEILKQKDYKEYLKTTTEPFIIAASMGGMEIYSYQSMVSQIFYNPFYEITGENLVELTKLIERL